MAQQSLSDMEYGNRKRTTRRVEDAIYDSYAMRKFMGINFLKTDVPDATTLLKFRHLLERHGLGKLSFDAINRCLERTGRMMRRRNTDFGTQIHEKRGQGPGPGDAPDEEGESMAFRDEMSYRRR